MEKLNSSTRRSFLHKIMQGIGYSAFGVIAWSAYLSQSQAKSLMLRPPGAIAEKDFVLNCIRCGMCVEACPYDVLKLSTISDKISIGTPYFTPREDACRLCSDAPCTSACPTNTLDINVLTVDDKLDINSARMGLATINTQTCLAYLGLQCTMCIRACPLADKAIVLLSERNPRTDMHAFLKPVVEPNYCTGCGMCEHACPTTVASIKVLPLSISKGDIGSHYVVGWEAKDEERLDKAVSTEIKVERTKRNEKSAIDNVNDVDGILKGLYNE
ncbi:Ferredoxin-type protein napG Precursor [Sulfurimonas gotlandica GD1]|uniref:Ferredoxin-type protein napG n=1 Tax=Sulfurimonas gotlandica (strain DSM 19862 / JCM 16533 / GD1) TaxID=929558 RepID=B6BNS5_SULGG|nr:ferredoxin-type protein NapG [Sulfurimonas gotlandica]EDZ61225.1 MauM/NapG ferredoxin-type protein [Sulfurimonas gotlandica GD1]EHP28879.1 Ferredoxin-type protein napG Precursor [Sulfurimonas gotlandica GD1]